MTTTITVTTHDWPVDVTTTDHYPAGRTISTSTVTVDPRSSVAFYITDTRTITFAELPLPVVDVTHPDPNIAKIIDGIAGTNGAQGKNGVDA